MWYHKYHTVGAIQGISDRLPLLWTVDNLERWNVSVILGPLLYVVLRRELTTAYIIKKISVVCKSRGFNHAFIYAMPPELFWSSEWRSPINSSIFWKMRVRLYSNFLPLRIRWVAVSFPRAALISKISSNTYSNCNILAEEAGTRSGQDHQPSLRVVANKLTF